MCYKISIVFGYLCLLYLIPVQAQQHKPVRFDFSMVPGTPKVFGEGVVSTGMYERDMAISPDGTEMFYTIVAPQNVFSAIIYLQKDAKGNWSDPEVASFSGEYSDMEPAFTGDGKKLFFVSNRPLKGDSAKDFDIWYVEKTNGKWANAVNIGKPVNTDANEFYPSLATNGNLYFTAAYDKGKGKEDIYVAKWENGKYADPVSLDTAINSSFYEFNAFVSRDEQFIIFTSFGRKDDKGRGDLYISQKDASGKWQPARNLAIINSERLDYCPFVSFDKKIFFFSSERSSLKETFVGAPAKYQTLIDQRNSILNGQSNIFWVSLDTILKF
ncbi:MAG: PD40 domain-containing protein [Bacteroidetes bacterium]|nr:PD40 domain-containing protein [Bacteroidota bacterium]